MKLFSHPFEYCVRGDRRLGCEQRVQEAGLRPRESEMISLDSAKIREQTIFFHPLFGNNPERAVIQPHRLLALFERAEQLRQRHLDVAELRAATHFEPIDA